MTNQRTNVVNGVGTTLASPMGASATSLTVASASGFPPVPFYLTLDPANALGHREVILVDTSVVGATLTLSSTANRYLAGSAAGSGIAHLAGEVVKFAIDAQLFDDLNDRIDAGYQPGGTDVLVTDGGTGASTASGARANLGLVYDLNVATPAAWAAGVAAEAALRTAADGTLTTNVATNTAGIATELGVRAAADTALSGRVTTVEAAYAAWTSYTPTLTQSGAVTKTVNYAKYLQMGKTVFCNVMLTITGAGSANNVVLVGLPVTASTSSAVVIGSGFLYDQSVGGLWTHAVRLASTTTVEFLATGGGSQQGLTGALFAVALANLDQVEFSIVYEAA